MAKYPDILPPFRVGGYNIKPSFNVLRTRMDSGFVRQRAQSPNDLTNIRGTILVDKSQLEIFRAWYQFRIGSGTEWFTMMLTFGEVPNEVEARFKGSYSVKTSGVIDFEVGMNLEVRDAPTITEDQLDSLIGQEET